MKFNLTKLLSWLSSRKEEPTDHSRILIDKAFAGDGEPLLQALLSNSIKWNREGHSKRTSTCGRIRAENFGYFYVFLEDQNLEGLPLDSLKKTRIECAAVNSAGVGKTFPDSYFTSPEGRGQSADTNSSSPVGSYVGSPRPRPTGPPPPAPSPPPPAPSYSRDPQRFDNRAAPSSLIRSSSPQSDPSVNIFPWYVALSLANQPHATTPTYRDSCAVPDSPRDSSPSYSSSSDSSSSCSSSSFDSSSPSYSSSSSSYSE